LWNISCKQTDFKSLRAAEQKISSPQKPLHFFSTAVQFRPVQYFIGNSSDQDTAAVAARRLEIDCFLSLSFPLVGNPSEEKKDSVRAGMTEICNSGRDRWVYSCYQVSACVSIFPCVLAYNNKKITISRRDVL
jgi:hypothetical protein